MKIDNSPSAGPTRSIAGGAAKTGKGVSTPPSTGGVSTPSSAGTSSGALVQLSAISSQLQTIESHMADMPVVDAARVSEIRQAIAEGRFKVNPNVVADHLLQTARELWHARQ
jgi:negative regulator of flagellin synthesis FlgM